MNEETPIKYWDGKRKHFLYIKGVKIYLKNLLSEKSSKTKSNISSNKRADSLDEELLFKKKLVSEITGLKEEEIIIDQLSQFTKEELENIKANKDLILDILEEDIIHIWELKELSQFTKEELENIKGNKDLLLKLKIVTIQEIGFFNLKILSLCQLDDEVIEYCNSKNIKDLWTILLLGKLIENNCKIREYLKRKQEYLENNRLLSDYEFEKLFWWAWKHWKWEIHQEDLWYCYLYTTHEVLKKMNFFDVLIKTNLKRSKDWNWWYVRLPMWKPDWLLIYVSEKEINKKFDISSKKSVLRRGVSINSDSPLWFKIMEIAYIKRKLIDISKHIRWEFLDTWDVLLTWERISVLEWWRWQVEEDIYSVLKILIWEEKIITLGSNTFNNYTGEPLDDNCMDIVFDNFRQWLIVNLSVKGWGSIDKKVKLDSFNVIANRKTIKNRTIKGILRKIKIYGYLRLIREMVHVDGKNHIVFYRNHAYSLEKCYIDKDTLEKRVWIVNPWHTWVKFDISLEDAKKIFDWRLTYIDIDKLFN